MYKTLLLLLLFCSCANDSTSDLIDKPDAALMLNLKWNKAYPEDTIDKSVIGLSWALSYVGALSPNSPSAINVGSNIITINIPELGFNHNALQKILLLSNRIKQSDEYQTTNAIDLGRYVTLLIGAPEHYYEITGVPKHLDELLAKYDLLPEKGYVNNSGVSLEDRIIRFSAQQNLKQLFLSSEIDPNSGAVYEYESVEIMENGQLRFGIFDTSGNRKNNADSSHSNAGKPGKCLWCHESNIQQLFNPQENYPQFLNYLQLQETLVNYNQTLREQRLELTAGVRFAETQQHTLTELLYISLMEPSAERLSLEWGISLAEVQNALSGLPTHTYDEFPFLGTLYDRHDVEPLAPFQGLHVSTKVREQSAIEVNHLN